ncbi:MAG: hydrogenase maturation protein [Nitrosomonas sp.]|nr:hydrogenase maturation protein [Nitrosomonas sp.]MDP1951539.1 hydrogenase maturation protein [Nitrosomonas sp.]
MKILFLTHSFNSLTQRLLIELTRCGHEISIEFDINDATTEQAVTLYQPELMIAPFLKRAIPETVWRRQPCFVVHPGIVGDRGPSALDWAIMQGRAQWGVTVLQANGEMDAGDIWAAETFPMQWVKKSSLYRHQVVETAVRAVLTAVARFQSGKFKPQPLDYAQPEVRGRLQAPIRQTDRAIDWARDDTVTVLKKIHAADGFPGVLDTFDKETYYLFDACAEDTLRGDQPGAIIAKRNGAICRATLDGAIWIGHLKRKINGEPGLKLGASQILKHHLDEVPEVPFDPFSSDCGETYRDIWFEQKNDVGYLHFAFYNGAMDSHQCERLREVYQAATRRNIRVIVLMGGPDFWSNGIHLNQIEQAASPADESWRNINAMNDLAQAIITTDQQLTMAALQGNAGAGGVFLSLAADQVYARASVILNPHYKSMGNLYGSEYWTYRLPRRVGQTKARALTQNRLPIGAAEARDIGLVDNCFALDPVKFKQKIEQLAQALAHHPNYPALLQKKVDQRRRDEQTKPLAAYRSEELRQMQLNFYGFDPSYHVARYHFVHKIPHAWTPLYLARHRRIRTSS